MQVNRNGAESGQCAVRRGLCAGGQRDLPLHVGGSNAGAVDCILDDPEIISGLFRTIIASAKPP